MSDRFKKWLGKIPIEVDGEEFDLDVRLEDTEKLLSLVEAEQNKVNMKGMNEVFFIILKRSYPDEEKESINAFLMKNTLKFMEKLMVALGWSKPGDFEQKAKN